MVDDGRQPAVQEQRRRSDPARHSATGGAALRQRTALLAGVLRGVFRIQGNHARTAGRADDRGGAGSARSLARGCQGGGRDQCLEDEQGHRGQRDPSSSGIGVCAHRRPLLRKNLSTQVAAAIPPRRQGACVYRRGPEFTLDSEQAIVFGRAIRARHRTGLDPAAMASHRQVRDAGVLGLAGTVRHDHPIAVAGGQAQHLLHLRQRADLVGLDQDGIGQALPDALLEQARIGAEHVVADQLATGAQPFGEHFPAGGSSSAMPSSMAMIG